MTQTVGLEFSYSKMIAMKRTVFGYGGLQVLISLLATAAIGVSVGMRMAESIVIGTVVAMSSTAIVLKQLSDQGELYTRHGKNAVGILLFQDLAVIPFLILVPSLALDNNMSLLEDVGFALVNGVIAVAILLAIGRYVVRPFFHRLVIKLDELPHHGCEDCLHYWLFPRLG